MTNLINLATWIFSCQHLPGVPDKEDDEAQVGPSNDITDVHTQQE